jgi:uncharacterized protein
MQWIVCLTGSANVVALPRLADSLAGRMQIITLWPISQGEIDGVRENFIDWLFRDDIALPHSLGGDWKEVLARAIKGGYPEALDRETDRLRRQWLDSYVTTLINRDVREVGNVRDLKAFFGRRLVRTPKITLKVSSASKGLHALPISALWRRYP